MATIWDDVNHSSGETFELTPRAPAKVTQAFSVVSEKTMTKISEDEYLKGSPKMEIRIPNTYKETPRVTKFYFKDRKAVYKVMGDNIPNGAFKWTTSGKSTNRGELTTLKELCSLVMMLHRINGTKPPVGSDELAEEVAKDYGFKQAPALMREVYFTSAEAHANNTRNLPFSGKYLGELQGVKFSKPVYNLAKKLTKKAADNWNPSDVWFVRKTDLPKVESMVQELETDIKQRVMSEKKIAYKFKDMLDVFLKEGILIGVSLKQVDRGAGKADLVSADNVRKKSSEMNFRITQNYIRDTSKGLPAYGEVRTQSGFNIKYGGRANAQKANINTEGQMAGASHQLGAIDAKALDAMAKEKKLTILKDSDFKGIETVEKLYDEYIGYLKKNESNIHRKFVGKRTKDEMLSDYDFVNLKRFFATISVFRFMKSLTTEEVLDLFLLAKKVDTVNPNYYLLH